MDGAKDLPVYWFGHMAEYWLGGCSEPVAENTAYIALCDGCFSGCVEASPGILLVGQSCDMEIFILLWLVVMGFGLCG